MSRGLGDVYKRQALSLCLRYVPLFSGISSGFAVILCAVIASAVGALLHPVKEAHAP